MAEKAKPSRSVDGIQFSPEFNRDRMLRQIQRLCEPLRARHANNRGGNARVAQRELQGCCCQWQTVALAGYFHLPGASKQFGRRLAIHIARIGTRALRQDTAPIWRGIQSCDSPAGAYFPERFGLPVEEREAVMRNGCLKKAGLDKAHHQVDRTPGDSQVRDQALCFTLL